MQMVSRTKRSHFVWITVEDGDERNHIRERTGAGVAVVSEVRWAVEKEREGEWLRARETGIRGAS